MPGPVSDANLLRNKSLVRGYRTAYAQAVLRKRKNLVFWSGYNRMQDFVRHPSCDPWMQDIQYLDEYGVTPDHENLARSRFSDVLNRTVNLKNL